MKTTKWKKASSVKESGTYIATSRDLFPNVYVVNYNKNTKEWTSVLFEDAAIEGIEFYMDICELPED